MSRRQSEAMKERWKDPEFRQKVLGVAPQSKGRQKVPNPRCFMEGPCFARVNGRCQILTDTFRGNCSFQKERRDDR